MLPERGYIVSLNLDTEGTGGYVLTIFTIERHMLNLSYKPQTFKMAANQELKTALALPNFSCTADDKTIH